MGAWGYEPFDSDGAHDWVALIERDIASEIRRTLVTFLKQKVKPIAHSVLDETKRAEYDAWRKKNRKGLRRKQRRRLPWSKWRKERAQFFRIVKEPGRASGHDVAEAAACLLAELTPYERTWQRSFRATRRYGMRRVSKVNPHDPGAKQRWGDLPVHLKINYEAEEMGLYTLAAISIRDILAEKRWLRSWRDPAAKRRALQKLLGLLEAKCVNEDAPRMPRTMGNRLKYKRAPCAPWFRRMKIRYEVGREDLQRKLDWIRAQRPTGPWLVVSTDVKDALFKFMPQRERREYRAEPRPRGGWFIVRGPWSKKGAAARRRGALKV